MKNTYFTFTCLYNFYLDWKKNKIKKDKNFYIFLYLLDFEWKKKKKKFSITKIEKKCYHLILCICDKQ